ncbi:hypothetical protein [Thalassotalea sediminis]|uniref:hypothetical protein n=1 Tax=Thalassotalea sediminis TaxID=1759089 RepID=UPI002572311A|nr:hypothetical protein [Thalassotalea sediminis]
MEQYKLNRLNILFEKVVSDEANLVEQHELSRLYREFIDDGRDKIKPLSISRCFNKASVG